jgi:hypothetical protein
VISYQSSKPFTHSLIIIATIAKAESHSTSSDLSAVKTEITTIRSLFSEWSLPNLRHPPKVHELASQLNSNRDSNDEWYFGVRLVWMATHCRKSASQS